jgi:hypothetical protein
LIITVVLCAIGKFQPCYSTLRKKYRWDLGGACLEERFLPKASRNGKVKDGSPITNVGDEGVDVLGDEVIFKLGTDSSPLAQNDNLGVAQNDNFSGNEFWWAGRILLSVWFGKVMW